jgi:hypothetical protein
MIAQRPPSSDVLDRVSLRGWNEPEGVAVFWVRRRPTGNRRLEAFRDRRPSAGRRSSAWAPVELSRAG